MVTMMGWRHTEWEWASPTQPMMHQRPHYHNTHIQTDTQLGMSKAAKQWQQKRSLNATRWDFSPFPETFSSLIFNISLFLLLPHCLPHFCWVTTIFSITTKGDVTGLLKVGDDSSGGGGGGVGGRLITQKPVEEEEEEAIWAPLLAWQLFVQGSVCMCVLAFLWCITVVLAGVQLPLVHRQSDALLIT